MLGQRWANIGPTVGQHWPNRDPTSTGSRCWPDVGPTTIVLPPMLAQRWANVAPTLYHVVGPTMALRTKLHWANADFRHWPNAAAGIGPTLAQRSCAIWVALPHCLEKAILQSQGHSIQCPELIFLEKVM